MRLFLIWVICQKELTETLRDRKTWMRLLLIPALVYPLFAIGVSKLEGSEAEAREARSSTVAVWGALPAEVERALTRAGKLELRPWEGSPEEVRRELEAARAEAPAPAQTAPPGEPPAGKKTRAKGPAEPESPVLVAARARIAARKIDAVLVPGPGFSDVLAHDGKASISVYFDSVRAESLLASERLDDALRASRRSVVEAREDRHGLPRGFSIGIDLASRNVAPDARRLGQVLGSMMPMLLIMMSLLGGFLPAIDFTAGEKERGTMQTLLCAPLHPIEIIGGKFLAVFAISLLTALANVVSLAFTLQRILPGEFEVSIGIYALTFVLLVPVTFLFAALFLALASFARDYKDGQNVLMPVYLPIMLVSGLTSLPGIELNAYTAFAPILNIALLIKALFLRETSPDLVLLALASSVLYAALALVLAARVFESTNVLLGGKESTRTLLGLTRRGGGEPSAAFSLTSFAVILVVCFYASLLLERLGTTPQILILQLGFFLLPTVGSLALFGFSLRASLALTPPSPRSMLAAVLLGLSGWAVTIGFILRLVPPPEAVVEKLSETLLLGGQPLIVLLLVTAVTPAICEELLFRGLVFSGLRRLGPVAAVVLSALLFGVAHASIYRFLPTFFLGLVLGLTRLRSRSIAPGMIIHALNNGIAVGLIHVKPSWAESAVTRGSLSLGATAAATAVFALGLALLPRPAPAPPIAIAPPPPP